MSTIKVNTLTTLNGSGNITVSRPFTGLSGSGASLTALNATELGSGTVPTARLGSGTANNTVFLRGDGTWTVVDTTNASNLSTGTLPIARIADDAITTAKMAPDAITAAEIADDVINSEHYAAASIDNEHLADDAVGVAELSATGTASSTTFLRGDNAWAAAGGGKILQVVTTTKSDTFTTTNTSMTDITGLTVNITPAATSSKILVFSAVNGSQDVGANRTYLRLMRDSTAIFVGDAASNRLRGSGSLSAHHATIGSPTVASCYVDSPSSTSSVTYKWQVVCAAGAGTAFINRTDADGDETGQMRTASTITVMEIGA